MKKVTFQVLGTILLLSALTSFAVSQEVVKNDKLIKVTDDVYLFGAGAFSLVVITGNGVIVVDPINPAQAAELSEAIKGLTDQRVKYVLYSHNHWDHIGGGQVFKEQNAIFASHIDTKRELKPNPTVISPQLTWDGSRSDLTLGNKTIERYHFGPSHGKGMTIFRVAEDDLIFVVDIAVPKRLPFMTLPDFDIDGWIYTLSEIEKLEFSQALFAHKAPDTLPIGTKADITAQREYVEDLIIAVKQAILEHGFSAAQNVSLPKYQDWGFYEEWLPLNALSIQFYLFLGL